MRLIAPKKATNPDQSIKKPTPTDLKEMLQVAKKYNVNLEAILPSKEAQARMPVPHHM